MLTFKQIILILLALALFGASFVFPILIFGGVFLLFWSEIIGLRKDVRKLDKENR